MTIERKVPSRAEDILLGGIYTCSLSKLKTTFSEGSVYKAWSLIQLQLEAVLNSYKIEQQFQDVWMGLTQGVIGWPVSKACSSAKHTEEYDSRQAPLQSWCTACRGLT